MPTYADMTPNAVASMDETITIQEVDRDSHIITDLLDYWRWLADQDTGLQLSTGHVWMLFYEGVRVGRAWSEICEDLGLPVRDDWL